MSTVHYKFKNARGYSTITFDGPFITLAQLKKEIYRDTQSKSSEVELKISNAQTGEGKQRTLFIPWLAVTFPNIHDILLLPGVHTRWLACIRKFCPLVHPVARCEVVVAASLPKRGDGHGPFYVCPARVQPLSLP